MVIETTGIADPAPVLQLILTNPMIRNHYELDGVVTTVDAVNGASSLGRFPECVKQAAIADRLIITKSDLVLGMDHDEKIMINAEVKRAQIEEEKMRIESELEESRLNIEKEKILKL